MVRDGCNYFLFWAIFCHFTSLTAQKIKVFKKEKKPLEISWFYIVIPKIMSRWCTVREKWCALNRRTGRQTGGQKKWHVEVRAPLKNKEIQPSLPLIKNTKEIRLCQSHPLSFLADIILKKFLKVNVNILQVCYSGIRQKHFQTENYKEFCYMIKKLIIDYHLYVWKYQNLHLSQILTINNRNRFNTRWP